MSRRAGRSFAEGKKWMRDGVVNQRVFITRAAFANRDRTALLCAFCLKAKEATGPFEALSILLECSLHTTTSHAIRYCRLAPWLELGIRVAIRNSVCGVPRRLHDFGRTLSFPLGCS